MQELRFNNNGFSGSQVVTSLNLHSSGILVTFGSSEGVGDTVIAAVTFEITILDEGTGASLLDVQGGAEGRCSGTNNCIHIPHGLVTQYPVPNSFTTPSFVAPLGEPLKVVMSVVSEAVASEAGPDPLMPNRLLDQPRALADWAHTLSFATDGPVFNVPDGVTVNSADAGIIDNRWTNPVPEPTSALLLGSGLFAAVAALRFRRAPHRAEKQPTR